MRSIKLKPILWIFVLLISLFVAGRLYYRITDDFRISNITYDFKGDQEWVSPSLTKEEQLRLATIFDQRFTYIGKGAQCYAFVSADQNYVLKFFKFKHLVPGFWVNFLPSISPFKGWKQNEIARKETKLRSVFSGYQLAYQENREGSGLLYLHFTPTNYFPKRTIVIDKMGIEREIDLDRVAFLLQKKGETFRSRLNYQLAQNNVEGAKHSIGQILEMYIREYQNGTYDRDHGVMHNTGFIGDHPFHLDIGKFSKEEKMKLLDVFKEDFRHIAWKIDTWIKNSHPKDYRALSTYIESRYHFYTDEALNVSEIDPAPYLKNKKTNWLMF